MSNVKFKPNLRRLVLDSYLFYSKMEFPAKDIVTPLANHLRERYGLDDCEADSFAVRVAFRASGLNGSKILELDKTGYALLNNYNLRDVVRNAISELKEVKLPVQKKPKYFNFY